MSSHSGSPEGSQTCLDSDSPDGRCKVLSLPNLRVLEPNDQIRELQTIIRDRYNVCAKACMVDVYSYGHTHRVSLV